MSKHTENLQTLRDLPDQELAEALARTTDELFRLRLGHHTNQIENTMSIRWKRRELARIKTIQRARALGLEAQQARRERPADEGAEDAPAAEAAGEKKAKRAAKATSKAPAKKKTAKKKDE